MNIIIIFNLYIYLLMYACSFYYILLLDNFDDIKQKKIFFFIIELVHLMGINYSSLKDHLVKFNICKLFLFNFPI
jgi:hypothetical protein